MGREGERAELTERAALDAWRVRQCGRFELVRGLSRRLRGEAAAFEGGADYEDVACAVMFDLIADMLENFSTALGPEVAPDV